jgi:DNA polymerase III subunit epsilon
MPADRLAVLDLETTGLSAWQHDRVVEVAVVVMTPDGAVEREYETLVNPQRDVGPTSIHRIPATDVLKAPTFSDIAGDLLEVLSGASVIAGHNVAFDMTFLIKEYGRLGVRLPAIPLLCTCRLFGRPTLRACCEELGISFDGMPHRALSDARATARVVSILCANDPTIVDAYRVREVAWPSLPPRCTPCYCREHADSSRNCPPSFLQRIMERIHHDTDAESPNVLAYMALIDRVLEDRSIDELEEQTLVQAALDWQLSKSQLESAHAHYLHNLAIAALADGVVTENERRDMHQVARLLGQDAQNLDSILDAAAKQFASACQQPRTPWPACLFHG